MKTKPKVSIDINFDCTLTELEARALVAMTRFSIEDFIKTFYKELGSSDLKAAESGLRLLWETANKLGSQLKYADNLHKWVSELENQ